MGGSTSKTTKLFFLFLSLEQLVCRINKTRHLPVLREEGETEGDGGGGDEGAVEDGQHGQHLPEANLRGKSCENCNYFVRMTRSDTSYVVLFDQIGNKINQNFKYLNQRFLRLYEI